MGESALSTVPGGQALIDWFGYVTHFHDGELLEIKLVSNGSSTLRIRTWRTTNKVDERGYFVLDKHVLVTISLEEVTHIGLDHFSLPGIIHNLQMTSTDPGFQLTWTGSYGVEGVLGAGRVRIEFTPEDT